MLNVINGGAHADNDLELQEFMLMPVGAASFSEALRWGVECFHTLRDLLHEAGMSTAVGDEGGFAPGVATGEEALGFLMRAIDQVGLEPGTEMAIALDPAASEFYKDARYHLEGADRTADDMTAFWSDLLDRFPIVSLEDPLAEDDWEGWVSFTRALGARVQVVGDDLFVTNTERLERGISDRRGERDLDQGEPDRDPHGDARRDRGGTARQFRRRRLAPERRDRRHHDLRSGRRDERRADEVRCSIAR